ncbi:MAG: hypothetical protein CMK07_10585 [Ponticaulis sp.]|nr:hypothetical protein [Ponticaulis sp.]
MKGLFQTLCAAAGALGLASSGFAATEGSHWEYEGAHGPDHWSELAPEFSSCRGGEQSPIDLNGQALPSEVHAPAIYWKNARVSKAINNGHTFQVNMDDAGKIVIDGVSYTFLQFHFHSGSEHTLHGRRFPMEVHLVHQADDGRLAVVGVMVERGERNELFDQLIGVMPGSAGEVTPVMSVDLNDFLPGDWEAYRYEGSLTTPPCSEVVSWTVFEKPITASPEQLAVFETLFPHSYRPVQPQNRRYVLKVH